MPENLAHYLTLWNLADPQPLAQTVTSTLYTVTLEGKTAVLKLLTAYGAEERVGVLALRCWNGQGAIHAYAHDQHAQLLEYAAGDDLVGMVRRGDDDQATEIIAGVLAQLHSAPAAAPTGGLYPLSRWFRELFRKAAADEQAGAASIYRRGAKIAAELLAHPREVCVLHGDIHHENIRHSARGWLAFDPKGVLGERTYDLANTFCNPLNMPERVENEARILRTAALFSEQLRIEPGRILAFVFAYACLSAAWSLNDNGDPSGALRIAALVEPHLPNSF